MTPENWALAERLLSQKELEAIKRVGNAVNRLSPNTASQLFSLFLQGYSIDALVKQNQNYGSLGLGLISQARVEYGWDQEREAYIKSLMESTRVSAEKSTLESLQFSQDGRAVYHRLIGGKFKKFLQSGNEEDLGEFAGMSFASYLKFVDLFRTMSGKETKSKVAAIQVEVAAAPLPTPLPSAPESDEGTMSASRASELLAEMLKGESKN